MGFYSVVFAKEMSRAGDMPRALPLPGLLPIVRPFSARRARAYPNTEAVMLEEKYTGKGKVLLLAGGGKI